MGASGAKSVTIKRPERPKGAIKRKKDVEEEAEDLEVVVDESLIKYAHHTDRQ